ncbi:Serine/threonine protein kinase [Saccharopolyspora antimicrobica]|uniref:non-specific serine/threonine protein kinase n=1 Tax=Saccharopolyspora antimicrobica TaxID=455193 RepID=A0A1I5FMW4_9PSEU|nr:serine/threonine-protein kinase [Saccharopolyspora antimicrobica]RKT82233.1 serine/threonine protein kinase [Saccharopolyspora antimicrobica]SFO24973.1 Serine/threonine protein kinase [Saccharopolyspora antimicrobica]
MLGALLPDDPPEVGSYRLLNRLGRGGMGRVYLGVSRGGRLVAVKVVRADLGDDPDFRRRFAREVTAARAVSGFYTAQVVDADPDADAPWLVTSYIPGPTLHEAVKQEGPLPPSALSTLGAGLAEGLGAIHACEVVHRDLKPSNVILAEDGPRVIDFGIARAVNETHTAEVFGTPAFMSPEQAKGEPVGAPADVFALGSLLVFAATGRGPFSGGESQAILYRVVHEAPDLSGLDQLPGELARIISTCLAKDPDDRPTAKQLLDSLADMTGDRTRWLPAEVVSMIDERRTATIAATKIDPLAGQALAPAPAPAPVVPSPSGTLPAPLPPPTLSSPPLPATHSSPHPPSTLPPATLSGPQPPPTFPPPHPLAGQFHAPPPPHMPPARTTPVGLIVLGSVLGGATLVALIVIVVLNLGSGPSSHQATPTPSSATTTSDDYPTESSSASTTAETSSNGGSLDDAATDRTPFTLDAFMPDDFTDDTGKRHTYEAGSTNECTDSVSDEVRSVLAENGCSQMMVANFIDDDVQIITTVWVFPFADYATASAVEEKFDAMDYLQLGCWDPNSGRGAGVCDGDVDGADEWQYIGQDHRYVIVAQSKYIDLRGDDSGDPALQSAGSEARSTVGPQNYGG